MFFFLIVVVLLKVLHGLLNLDNMLCFAHMETCSFSNYVQTAFLSIGIGKQENSS